MVVVINRGQVHWSSVEMLPLTVIGEPYRTTLLVPEGAPGGRVPVSPASGIGIVGIKSPLEPFIIEGDKLPAACVWVSVVLPQFRRVPLRLDTSLV